MSRSILRSAALLAICFACLSFSAGAWVNPGLSLSFYQTTCPQLDSIVNAVVARHLLVDPTLAGSLLRFFFHDCIVRGCDASILLNSTATNSAEKDGNPNKNSLRGYEVFDDAKAALELACKGIVSCADIIALVSRDAVNITGGPYWKVYLGRRDGLISSAAEANNQIPSPTFTYPQLMTAFANIGLSQHDLVVLSGAHTIGITHCTTIMTRIWNFTGVGDMDPALDPQFGLTLRQRCPQTNPGATIPMDFTSPTVFDNSYYTSLKANRSMFASDAALLTARFSNLIVTNELQSSDNFFSEFPISMMRMSATGVLLGTQGEIRANCAVVNS